MHMYVGVIDKGMHAAASGSSTAEYQTTSHVEFSRKVCSTTIQDEYWNLLHSMGSVTVICY